MASQMTRSILTILLNNGCSYQDPALVAILRYFVPFWDQTYHFKERFLLDSRTFHFKSEAFSYVTSQIPALWRGHD